jgi:hypothetical protein
MTKTDYPVAHNCNLSTREDDRGQRVWQAVQMADAGKFDQHDRDERHLLDCLERLEEVLEEFAIDDSAEAGNTCRAAEEAVAEALKATRVWFLDAFKGERYDAPQTRDGVSLCEWQNIWPVIDRDGNLTGDYSEGDDHLLVDNGEAMISVDEARAGGWKIDADEGRAEAPEPPTRKQIAALQDEAAAAGDDAMVAICAAALDGDPVALAAAAQCISDAAAQRDE